MGKILQLAREVTVFCKKLFWHRTNVTYLRYLVKSIEASLPGVHVGRSLFRFWLFLEVYTFLQLLPSSRNLTRPPAIEMDRIRQKGWSALNKRNQSILKVVNKYKALHLLALSNRLTSSTKSLQARQQQYFKTRFKLRVNNICIQLN